MFKRLKYYYQRCKNGFSEEDCWNLGYHLMTIIPPMVRKLKTGVGCPSELWEEGEKDNCQKWHDILEEIAQGFEAGQQLSDMHAYKWVEGKDGYTYEFDELKNKQLSDKYNRGVELLSRWLLALWD